MASGFYRYGTPRPGSEDGYGDCYAPDPTNCPGTGRPWPPTDTGSGHLWPVLAGERGEYELAAGDTPFARTLLKAMAAQTSGGYLEPEQTWEDPAVAPSPYASNPSTASIGFAPGQPAGSASPLTWAQAQYARLALNLSAGHDLDTPSITTDRYVTHGMPGTLPLSITSPAAGSNVTGSTVTVTGTTAPGADVVVEAVGARGRHGHDGPGDSGRFGQLVGDRAGELWLHDDHGHGHPGCQNGLQPARRTRRDPTRDAPVRPTRPR